MENTYSIMLVRPRHFAFNEATHASNAFQRVPKESDNVGEKARLEFDNFVSLLQENNVSTLVFEDTADPVKPDAIFPNNWVTFHAGGTAVLYPMYAPNRRVERRKDIIASLQKTFEIKNIIDLSVYEKEHRFLEGTGSMVFDYAHRKAYACLSPRTDAQLTIDICKQLGYEPILFHAYDQQGIPIYHTNVMMCIAKDCVVLSVESISSVQESEKVLSSIVSTGRKIISITYDQVKHFAGNMLQVTSNNNDHLMVMSQQAYQCLTAEQKEIIANHHRVLAAPIPTIEAVGGGGVRCMMAEVLLQMKVPLIN